MFVVFSLNHLLYPIQGLGTARHWGADRLGHMLYKRTPTHRRCTHTHTHTSVHTSSLVLSLLHGVSGVEEARSARTSRAAGQ